MTLRLAPTERKYRAFISRGYSHRLEDLPAIAEFKHFKIIEAEFPHDKIARTHHLLIPKRIVDHWTKLNWRERREFKKLDWYLSANYDCIKLNYPSYITISYIVHWHLYILK